MKIKTALALVAASVATLGACSPTEQVEPAGQNQPGSDSTSFDSGQSDADGRADETSVVNVSDLRSIGQTARDVAEHEAGGGNGVVIAIDPDRDGTVDVDVAVSDAVYEVEVYSDGRTRVTDRDSVDGEDQAAESARIDIYDAIESALAENPGELLDASMDGIAWEIDVLADGAEYHVYVDPDNGEILGVELED